MFWVRTRFSGSEHISPTQSTFPRLRTRFYKNFRSWELGVLEKRVLSENTFLRLRTRFSDSEHVSPTQNTFLDKIFGVGTVRSFGKTCSEWEHVSLTQSTFLRLTARFPDSEHVSTKFSELGVRSFGKTCSEWEHVFLAQSTFLRLRARSPDSEHVSTKILELGVRSFGKTCSAWETLRARFSDSQLVSPTQNTFLRNFRSWELGVLEKRVLSENTFLRLASTFPRLRTRFYKIFGVGS